MALMVKLKLPTCVQPDVVPRAGTCGVHTNKIEFMKRHLLDEIPGKPFAPDFMQPVDTEALRVPSYYMIIRDPMDVGTIIKRVQNQFYSCVDELITDFRLVISNCFTFNRPGEVVYRKGMQLEKFFLKVLAQLPMGPEVKSDKDPRACRSPPPSVKTSTARERQCREDLKKLQNSSIEGVDEDVKDFFKDKWSALGKKINKHTFKTHESFHQTVDNIFLQSQAQAKRIYENAFYVPLDSVPHQPKNSQLNELLYEVKRVDGSLRSPYNAQATWESGLMEGIDFIIDQMKKKLDTSHQLEQKRCQAGQSASSSKVHKPSSQMPVPTQFGEVERRAMQQQFVLLPMHVKNEIMSIIGKNEDTSCESSDLKWSDFKKFKNETLLAMKKAMLPHSKLNLRKMKPAEKEDLQRTLESRLETINQALNGNRRKATHKPRVRSTMPAKKRARYATSTPGNQPRGSSLPQQQQQHPNQQLQRKPANLPGSSQGRDSQGSDDDSDSSDSSSSSSSSSDSTDRSDPSNESC